MQIAFVVENNLGHRTHLRYLRRYMPMEGIEPVWLPIEPYADDRWQRLLGRQPPLSWSGRAWSAIRALGPMRVNIDLYYFHTVNIALAARLVCGRTPWAVSLDGTPEPALTFDDYRQRDGAGGLKLKLREWLYRSTLGAATRVIGLSPWVTESVCRHYGLSRAGASTHRHGVDTALWGSMPAQPAPGKPRILFVGGDFERKGGSALVRVWRNKLSAVADLDIVSHSAPPGLAGEPGVRVIRELEGESAALRRMFAEASVFALPSLADTVPWVLLEAMAAGLPTVSTSVGGVPSIVDDGGTGLLIAPGDDAALAASLGALLGDRTRAVAMGAAGRARVVELFDAETNYRALARHLIAAAREPEAMR